MAHITTRIDRAQAEVNARTRTAKGWRTVYTCGGAMYWEHPAHVTAIGDKMRWSFPDADGKPPDGARVYARADIDALLADGWQVIVVRYADDATQNTN